MAQNSGKEFPSFATFVDFLFRITNGPTASTFVVYAKTSPEKQSKGIYFPFPTGPGQG